MRKNPHEMDSNNFSNMLEASSQVNDEFEDTGEQISTISKVTILTNEKLQLQEEIAQLWNYLAESKSRQTVLEDELETNKEAMDSLVLINEQTKENLKKIREHQNSLVDFILNLEANRNEVAQDVQALKQEYEETFQELSDKLQHYQKDDSKHEIEILTLKEQIRQQDEKLVEAMQTHCKDQELITETNEKLKSAKDAECTREELETLRSQHKQKEEAWKKEKDYLMENIENIRDKFSTDLMTAKETMETLSKLRHQELQQFKTQLKVQLEKNNRLEEQVKSLEYQLAIEKENIKPNTTRTPAPARNKKQISSSSYSDADTSDLSIQPNQEPLFKKRKIDYFASDSDQPMDIIRDKFFRPLSIPVDSTSGPSDKVDARSQKTV